MKLDIWNYVEKVIKVVDILGSSMQPSFTVLMTASHTQGTLLSARYRNTWHCSSRPRQMFEREPEIHKGSFVRTLILKVLYVSLCSPRKPFFCPFEGKLICTRERDEPFGPKICTHAQLNMENSALLSLGRPY